MKKSFIYLASLVSAVFVPVIAFAQVDTAPGTIGYIVQQVGNILNMIIPIMVVIAIIYFIWGVIKYVISGDEEDKVKGRSMIIYGIIGIAVIVALWGFVRLLTNTLGVNDANSHFSTPTVDLQSR